MSSDKAQKSGKIRAENLKNILEAAELSFVQHGYKGTSMQAIADAAGLPKANVLYYFKSKQALYTQVLEKISTRWDETLEHITEADEPAETLARYIANKVDLAIRYPNASKIFATEIIHGAPHLKDHLRNTLRQWVREKTRVMDAWVAQGKMAQVNTEHLIYMIWSTTQHYADFETQILTVSNKQDYDDEDVVAIKRFLIHMILTGAGLQVPDWAQSEQGLIKS